jgi:DNA polymerase III delta subunit
MLTVIVGTKKRPAGAEELKWEGLSADELATLASTPSLFGGTRTFVLAGVLAGAQGEAFLDLAAGLVESPHTFIFEEEKLLKAPTVALEKAGAKIEVIKTIKAERGFDPFGLTYALGNRDRKKLWLALTQALRAGEKPEAIGGLLAWKARAMGDTQLSRTLTFMYHDSHRGAGDLELLLEKFALTL